LGTSASGFLCVALAGTAPAAVPAILGQRWSAIVPLLAYAAGGIMLGCSIAPIANGYFNAIGRPGVPLRVVTLHTAMQFAVTIPLLSDLGSEALGIGDFAAAATDTLLLGWALHRVGVRVASSCAVPIVLSVAVGGVGWAVAKAVEAPVLGLILSGVLVECLYLGGLALLRPQTVRELIQIVQRYRLKRIRARRVTEIA
jgi:O-antigen/teichoic acid export membrane protein